VYARFQARRLEAAERSFCRAAALTLAIQDLERDALRALAPGAWIETLPVGIDLDRFGEPRPAEPPIRAPRRIVCVAADRERRRTLPQGWMAASARGRAGCAAAPRGQVAAGQSRPGRPRRRGGHRAGRPSMAEEMARASVMVVPLWSGGRGSRQDHGGLGGAPSRGGDADRG
jgi:hypothetical protein